MRRLQRLVLAFIFVFLTVFNVTQSYAATELIKNPSFETLSGSLPASWSDGSYGTNTRTLSVVSDAHSGTRAGKVSITSYTNGDAKWYANPVAITGGQAYTFSVWYKSNVTTDLAAFVTQNGVNTYTYLSSLPAAASYTQKVVTFTAPSGSNLSMTVFNQLSKVGWVVTDDYSLTSQAPTPTQPVPSSPSNLVANPSFETLSGSLPASWSDGSYGTNTRTLSVVSDAHSGTRAGKVSITSYTNGDAKWYANPVSVQPGQTYDFSLWYKSNAYNDLAAFVTVDGVTNYQWLAGLDASNSYAQKSVKITIPSGSSAKLSVFTQLAAVGWTVTDDYSLTAASVTQPPTTSPTIANWGMASITFDDGLTNQYVNARPVLQSRGVNATFYVIGDGFNWGSDYMTPTQVIQLGSEGNEIGNHSMTHANLSTLSAASVASEFTRSQNAIRSATGITPATCAYPYGAYNATVTAEAAKQFKACRTTDSNATNTPSNYSAYKLKVFYVLSSTTAQEVKDAAIAAKASGEWIIYVYHGIVPSSPATIYDTTTSLFAAQVDAIKSTGIPVKTVASALTAVGK